MALPVVDRIGIYISDLRSGKSSGMTVNAHMEVIGTLNNQLSGSIETIERMAAYDQTKLSKA